MLDPRLDHSQLASPISGPLVRLRDQHGRAAVDQDGLQRDRAAEEDVGSGIQQVEVVFAAAAADATAPVGPVAASVAVAIELVAGLAFALPAAEHSTVAVAGTFAVLLLSSGLPAISVELLPELVAGGVLLVVGANNLHVVCDEFLRPLSLDVVLRQPDLFPLLPFALPPPHPFSFVGHGLLVRTRLGCPIVES